ncbi:hypothetical protein LJC05_00805 [Bacteroides sp. OttesenSCG-928-J23]|nr:hypothetical protein [Bacteroides sp. OttesenSCG-928-J23]MDL2299509.1 hypothetical protein [Bacteroides sp. OttesenSCG-928-E20]
MNRNRISQLSILNCAFSIALAALLLLLAACQQADELGTDASLAITVAPPPAWQAADDHTRATISDTYTTTWTNGDRMTATLKCYHASGLEETISFNMEYNGSKWNIQDPAPTWPIGKIVKAELVAWFNNHITDGTQPIFRGTDNNVKITPDGRINLNITFGADAHHTAAVYLNNTSGVSVTMKVGNNTPITIPNDDKGYLYPKLSADATQITGTVGALPFALDVTGSPLGKVYTVGKGDKPGGSNPIDITENTKIKEATDAFVRWAKAYNDGTREGYTLQYHIDLTEHGDWTPIGYSSTNVFAHVFDGAGYTIRGLKIDEPSKEKQALFGNVVSGATIKNVHIVDCKITGATCTGALVGYNNQGKITNCSATGTVTGTGQKTGGLVGNNNNNGTITACYATGTVIGTSYVGGLVGENNKGKITACYATGGVTGSSYWTGGLVGYNNSGTITACYATGDVTGAEDYTGGLVGYNKSSTITACYATGNVTNTGTNVGALVGVNSTGTITYSHAVPGGTVTRFVGNVASNPTDGDANGNSVEVDAASATVRAWPGTVNNDGATNYWNTEEPPKLYWQ